MNEKKGVEIGWNTLWRISVLVAIIYIGIQARMVIGVFLISIVLSLGLDPFVSLLERLRIPRLLGSIFTFFIGILLVASIAYFVAPFAIAEAGSFAAYVSAKLSVLLNVNLPSFSLDDIRTSVSEAFGFFGLSGASLTGAIGGAIGGVATRIALTIATIMISFYLTVERDGTERLLKAILPEPYERAALSVFSDFKTRIRRWFSAQLLLSIIMGTVTGLGMWLLGVQYAFILGILAAVFELVPMIGPVIAGAASFFVATTDSFSLGIYTIIFFMLMQQLENHVLLPFVMGKTVKVHPVMTIVSILVGGQVAGLLGMVLAVPLAVLVQEVFSYLAEQRKGKQALGH